MAVAVRGERAERDGRRVPLSNPEDLFLCIDISLDLESDHFNFDDPFTGVEAITGLRSRTGSVVVRHEVLAARSPFSVWEAKRGGHLLPDASGLAVDLDQVSRKVYEAKGGDEWLTLQMAVTLLDEACATATCLQSPQVWPSTGTRSTGTCTRRKWGDET